MPTEQLKDLVLRPLAITLRVTPKGLQMLQRYLMSADYNIEMAL